MKRTTRYKVYRKAVTKATVLSAIDMNPGPFVDVDHIVPKAFGFKHDIPAELIGSRDNLQLLPRNANTQKGQRLTEEGLALLEKWGQTDERIHDIYVAYRIKHEGS